MSLYNYLLFHSLVELSAVIVAFAVFMLFWSARRSLDNGFYIFVGIACLAGGILDLAHVLTYQGVGRGSGQGLAIAYTIVTRKHGGTMRFETEPGRGTTFYVTLPLRADDLAAARPQETLLFNNSEPIIRQGSPSAG